MGMIWTTITKYSAAGWSLLLTFGASLVTFLLMLSAKNRREKREAEARVKRLREVMERDKEVARESAKRLKEAEDEIDRKKSSSELENPNEW